MSVHRHSINRRTALLGGVAATGAAALPLRFFRPARAQADDDPPENASMLTGEQKREMLETYGFVWSATSPSTHKGDSFTLTVTNRGTSVVKAMPHVMIMDHTKHYNLPVIEEEIELAAGETREFSASNDYGVANHFSTNMFADTGDVATLGVEAVMKDASGAETASFNERAFWIKSPDDLEAIRESKKDDEAQGEGHKQHGDTMPDDDMPDTEAGEIDQT